MNGLKFFKYALPVAVGLLVVGCGQHSDEPEMPDNQADIAGRSESNPDTVWMGSLFNAPTTNGSLFYDDTEFASFTPRGSEWGVTKVFTEDTEREMSSPIMGADKNKTISFDVYDIRTHDGIIDVVAPFIYDPETTPFRLLWIELSYPNRKDTVTVYQEAHDIPACFPYVPKFVFTPSNAAFNADGGRMVFTITGQPDDGCSYWQFWGTSEEPGLPFEQPNSINRRGTKTYGWLTVTVDGEHLILDAEPNTSGKYRQKWLRFKIDGPDSWPIGFIVTQSAR